MNLFINDYCFMNCFSLYLVTGAWFHFQAAIRAMDAVTSFMAARGATVNRYMVSGASKVEISLVTNCQIFLLLNIGPSVYHQNKLLIM